MFGFSRCYVVRSAAAAVGFLLVCGQVAYANLQQPLPTPGTLSVEDDSGAYDWDIKASWSNPFAIPPSGMKIQLQVRKKGTAAWTVLAQPGNAAKSVWFKKFNCPSFSWGTPQSYEFRLVYVRGSELKSSNIVSRTFETWIDG